MLPAIITNTTTIKFNNENKLLTIVDFFTPNAKATVKLQQKYY